jgi:hypothetical protein
MFVRDLLNYQTARLRFSLESADSHATVREAKLDCVFEPKWFVKMNIIIRSLQFVSPKMWKPPPKSVTALIVGSAQVVNKISFGLRRNDGLHVGVLNVPIFILCVFPRLGFVKSSLMQLAWSVQKARISHSIKTKHHALFIVPPEVGIDTRTPKHREISVRIKRRGNVYFSKARRQPPRFHHCVKPR